MLTTLSVDVLAWELRGFWWEKFQNLTPAKSYMLNPLLGMKEATFVWILLMLLPIPRAVLTGKPLDPELKIAP